MRKMKIKNIKAKKILNSSGNWTVECRLTSQNNQTVSASVPAGISTGKDEKATSPILKALDEINNQIFPKVKNLDLNQEELDQILAANQWGSNATLAVSAAYFKLKETTVETKPQMMMLVFEGGEHGNPNIKIQEFMIVTENLVNGIDFYKKTQQYLKENNHLDTVGSEGGMSPKGLNDNDLLEILTELEAKKIALDVAANVNPFTVEEMLTIIKTYPIFSLEDPFPEDNHQQWQTFFNQTQELGTNTLIIGDDITVTDPDKIKFGADKLFNGVVIKPNQQGTITKAVEALKVSKKLGLKTIVSHRGQETNDAWIADFALRYQADFIKFGAPNRGERIAKYNRILELI